MKRILLLYTTTGYPSRAYLKAAKSRGYETLIGTDRCHRLEDPWQDDAIPLRFETPQASCQTIQQYAKDKPVQGIIPIGDRPVLTAAMASEALGLLGNSPHSVSLARNKYLFRQTLLSLGIRTPWFARYHVREDPARILSEVPFPCVLKPLAQTASFGVIRANDVNQFVSAFSKIRLLLKNPEIQAWGDETSDYILVESFISGKEITVEGILDEGCHHLLAIFDKPEPLDGPFFEETIYRTPTRLNEEEISRVLECTQEVVEALGLCNGPIHAEIRMNQEGPMMVEIAPRSIGGLCSRSLRFGSDGSLEEIILHHALGDKLPLIQQDPTPSAVMMIPIPESGEYQGVSGLEEALATADIQEIILTAKQNQDLKCLPEGTSYLGFIFARSATYPGVQKALKEAYRKLCFNIQKPLPVV